MTPPPDAFPPNRFLLTAFVLDQPDPALSRLGGPGWDINAPTIPGASQMARLAVLHRHLSGLVAASVGRGARPVSIAGDCCATIGVLAGLQRAGLDPVVVWLDAHGDFNTHETTISGFLGGMPLAMITGRGDTAIAESAGLRFVADASVFLCDARDLDPRERELLASSGVHHLRDPADVPSALPEDRPIYVHLDVDILDPSDAPAMKYPAPGGPSLESLVSLGEALRASGRLAGVSVTTWDLATDRDGRTERSCLAVLRALTGP
jgi:arginase